MSIIEINTIFRFMLPSNEISKQCFPAFSKPSMFRIIQVPSEYSKVSPLRNTFHKNSLICFLCKDIILQTRCVYHGVCLLHFMKHHNMKLGQPQDKFLLHIHRDKVEFLRI